MSRRVKEGESWIRRARPRIGERPGGSGRLAVGGISRMQTAAPEGQGRKYQCVHWSFCLGRYWREGYMEIYLGSRRSCTVCSSRPAKDSRPSRRLNCAYNCRRRCSSGCSYKLRGDRECGRTDAFPDGVSTFRNVGNALQLRGSTHSFGRYRNIPGTAESAEEISFTQDSQESGTQNVAWYGNSIFAAVD